MCWGAFAVAGVSACRLRMHHLHLKTVVQVGPKDVTRYSSPEQGVWYPRGPRHTSLRWRGGPLARFSKSNCPLNPFSRDRMFACALSNEASAASLAFTVPGKYMDFMHLPSCPGDSRLRAGCPLLQDCSPEVEKARGNVPLARLDAMPGDNSMTEEQWVAFAGLRAFPCLQIRNLGAGLAQETLLLERPEVCPSPAASLLVACLLLFLHYLQHRLLGDEPWHGRSSPPKLTEMWAVEPLQSTRAQ